MAFVDVFAIAHTTSIHEAELRGIRPLAIDMTARLKISAELGHSRGVLRAGFNFQELV